MSDKRKKKQFDFGREIRAKFVNNETPGVPIKFNFQGRNFGQFEDGEEYHIPIKVMNHLNSLAVPTMRITPDPETKQLVSSPVGKRNRFSVLPVGDDFFDKPEQAAA